MEPQVLSSLANFYRERLFGETMPFWLDHAIDETHGGYFTSLDQGGNLLDRDKSVWFQGRFAWVLSTLAAHGPAPELWLRHAQSGLDFLERHCVDTDGRYFFLMTAEGRPLRKRRYMFSECFAAMAMAAYGNAADRDDYRESALQLFRQIIRWTDDPVAMEPKVNPAVRPMKSMALPMILIGLAGEVRAATGSDDCDRVIQQCIAEVERDFVRPEFQCVLETVGEDGQTLDTFDGRMINPGHSLELGWFILAEARHRQSQAYRDLALKIIDWSLDIGWDQEHGGLYYFRDCKGLPCTEYWHDMKFWWPHAEAIIATLMAWRETGEERYWEWFQKFHQWSHDHFHDPEHGEWFGYLHRDGTISTTLKGNHWKGPFHLPRMQWHAIRLLEE